MWLYTHIIISSSCTSRWCKWKKILFWMFVLMSNSVAWFSFNNLENHLIYYRRASKFLEFFKTIYQIWKTWRIINDWKIVQPHKNFSIFYAIKNLRKNESLDQRRGKVSVDLSMGWIVYENCENCCGIFTISSSPLGPY